MAGTTVSAGPFVGGLNTLSDPGAIADAELVLCQNFEVDPDGALKSRPPFVNSGSDFPGSGGFRILGPYTAGNVTKLIGSGSGSTFYLETNGVWTLLTNTFAATDFAQFNGTLYLLAPAGSSAPSGYWNGTFTPDATMPKGDAIVPFKGRLWVGYGSTVQYSSTTQNASFWTVGSTFGGTFQVGGGDGQSNVTLLVLSSTLLIFRTNSIWQFSYSTDPIYGSQAVLVPDVGLSDRAALEVFEGVAYFMYDGKAYVLNGATAQQLNPNVPFTAVLRSNAYLPFAVSVAGRRIIFTYYDTLYVWNLRSRTWTTWKSPTYVGIGKVYQFSGAVVSDNPVYMTHSNFLGSDTNQKTLRFTDGYTADAEPTYQAILQTKTFDYATPSQMKRLFYWGIDAIFKSSMIGTVLPELFSSRVTWGQALQTTWGQARNFTWSQSSIASTPSTTVTPAAGGVYPSRKFVKLGRSMRSRRLSYRIQIPVDGSVSTSPAKVFGIETIIAVKQLVSKQIS